MNAPSNDPNSGSAAALSAAGALGLLDGDDLAAYDTLAATAEEADVQRLSEDQEIVALLSLATVPPVKPPASLREKVLQRAVGEQGAEKPAAAPEARPIEGAHGFHFLLDENAEWHDLPVRGARVRELSRGRETGRAVYLLDLAPDTRFPVHRHSGAEEVYLISGDLTTGGIRMKPGDYMRADEGSVHSELYSEEGCLALVISDPDDFHASEIRTYSAARRLGRKLRSLLSLRPPKDPGGN